MKRTRPSAKRPEPITAQQALELLESAVSYCQSAGLKVSAVNGNDGTLGLFIGNARYVLANNGTQASFQPITFPNSEPTDIHSDIREAKDKQGNIQRRDNSSLPQNGN